jgi:hypothetical protein
MKYENKDSDGDKIDANKDKNSDERDNPTAWRKRRSVVQKKSNASTTTIDKKDDICDNDTGQEHDNTLTTIVTRRTTQQPKGRPDTQSSTGQPSFEDKKRFIESTSLWRLTGYVKQSVHYSSSKT